MTREEAKRFWLIRYENAKDFSDPHWEAQERREHREYVEALRMAIEALQDEAPKPTGELIARADAIEAVMAEGHKVYTSEYASAERVIYEADAVEALSMLPSSEAVQGEWILVKGSNGKDYHKCSKCLHTQEITGVKNYCAVCGARMKGGDSE